MTTDLGTTSDTGLTPTLAELSVLPIPSREGRAFIRRYHYTRGSHGGPLCYGLIWRGVVVGVCAFANPASEAVKEALFGPEGRERVTELHRLVLLDEVPANAESWFVSRCLKALKRDFPQTWAVVSFADSAEGHHGIIYQATNAIYTGMNSPTRFYRDQEGRLRSPRQNGHNVTVAEAEAKGWKPEVRAGKHRYVFLLGDSPSHARTLRRLLRYEALPYPKEDGWERPTNPWSRPYGRR